MRLDIGSEIMAVGKNVVFVSKICRQVDRIPGLRQLCIQFREELKRE
jgi:hypothetical protein